MNQLNGAEPLSAVDSSGDMNSSVVTVNFGLKWRHLAMGATALASVFGSIVGAGWLVLPAKQTDMTVVQQQLAKNTEKLDQTTDALAKLTEAVDRLNQQVKLIRISKRKLK